MDTCATSNSTLFSDAKQLRGASSSLDSPCDGYSRHIEPTSVAPTSPLSDAKQIRASEVSETVADRSDIDSDDEFARALDAEPWDSDTTSNVSVKRWHREPTAVEIAVLSGVDIAVRISSFSESLHLSQLAALSRSFDEATQVVMRQRACGVLSEGIPMFLAAQVEACVYAHCGSRAGPGCYNAKVRQLILNLRGNEVLASRVRNGTLAPDSLVRLSSDAMRTSEAQRRDEQWRRAVAESAIRQPAPAHFINIYACASCGCRRQWLRSRVRLSDITMTTEFLVCVECHKVVVPTLVPLIVPAR